MLRRSGLIAVLQNSLVQRRNNTVPERIWRNHLDQGPLTQQPGSQRLRVRNRRGDPERSVRQFFDDLIFR